jgi:hypothetical protein
MPKSPESYVPPEDRVEHELVHSEEVVVEKQVMVHDDFDYPDGLYTHVKFKDQERNAEFDEIVLVKDRKVVDAITSRGHYKDRAGKEEVARASSFDPDKTQENLKNGIWKIATHVGG